MRVEKITNGQQSLCAMLAYNEKGQLCAFEIICTSIARGAI